MPSDDGVAMDEPMFGTPYQEKLGDFDFYAEQQVKLVSVGREADRDCRSKFSTFLHCCCWGW